MTHESRPESRWPREFTLNVNVNVSLPTVEKKLDELLSIVKEQIADRAQVEDLTRRINEQTEQFKEATKNLGS